MAATDLPLIEADTGRVNFIPGFPIGPDLIKSVFLATFIGQHALTNVLNPPWHSFWLPTTWRCGHSVGGIIYFHGERLAMLTFSFGRPGENWGNWTYEREMERKSFHDDLLQRDLGDPPYRFHWGEISSDYDEKGGGSAIGVRYADTAGH
jgi:hypothetical protein